MNRRSLGWLALWPAALLWAGFFWPFLLVQKAFTLSDYSVQHLPWARVTYEAVREGRLPFWTDAMGCGFPLFAEGQSAALYLPHWFAYKLLPFWSAYAWSAPAHFAAGTIGMFLYARRLGLGSRGASLAATVFAFGGSYAGCFYNAGSLRALCWLPWVLALFEIARRASGRRRVLWFLCAAVLVSQQWTAGFAQMAVYAFGYLLLHESIRLIEERAGGTAARRLAWMAAAAATVLIGTAMALPQIVPSLELIGESVRKGESASFALWGSVPPLAPVSLAFPEWGNALRFSFYIGVFPLLLCVVAAARPWSGPARRHLLLAGFFFLLAIGRFNPVYAWAVETFSLTFFRNPAKFLFFVSTSLAVLAGCGFDRLERVIRGEESAGLRLRLYTWAAPLSILALPALAGLLARAAAGAWPAFSDWYVTRLIAEKGAAAKDAAHYHAMMMEFFAGLDKLFSYANPLNLQTAALTTASAGIIALALSRHETLKRLWVTGAAVLVWDLWVFGWLLGTGFIGNAGPLPQPRPDARMAALISQARQTPGRLAECTADWANERLAPNSNLMYGLAHAGAYSPLLLRGYYDLYAGMGFADSSLGRTPQSAEAWSGGRHLLDLAGVRHLHSDERIKWKDWTTLKEAPGFYLYENPSARPGLSVFYEWDVVTDPSKRVERLRGEWSEGDRRVVLSDAAHIDGLEVASSSRTDARLLHRFEGGARQEYEITTNRSGIAVAAQMAYPGWKVLVDGAPTPWFPADHAFLAFRLPAGEHRVRLEYEPTGWKGLVKAAFWTWGIVLAAIVICAAPLPRRR